MSAETWRPVAGWDGYEVSDQGRVRSITRRVPSRWGTGSTRVSEGRVLRHNISESGHHIVVLCRGGERKPTWVHRLVLEAFVGAQPSPDSICCHNDGNPANNVPSNLRWGTAADNAQDTVRHGRNPNANKVACIRNHPYDEANTYFSPAGGRYCRACRAAAARALRAGMKSGRGVRLADFGEIA